MPTVLRGRAYPRPRRVIPVSDDRAELADEVYRRHYDVVMATLRFLDSKEFREQYGDPPGDLRAHLLQMGGELKSEIGKENLPLHINHTEPDKILEGAKP